MNDKPKSDRADGFDALRDRIERIATDCEAWEQYTSDPHDSMFNMDRSLHIEQARSLRAALEAERDAVRQERDDKDKALGRALTELDEFSARLAAMRHERDEALERAAYIDSEFQRMRRELLAKLYSHRTSPTEELLAAMTKLSSQDSVIEFFKDGQTRVTTRHAGYAANSYDEHNGTPIDVARAVVDSVNELIPNEQC